MRGQGDPQVRAGEQNDPGVRRRGRAVLQLLVVGVVLVGLWWTVDMLWLGEVPAVDRATHDAFVEVRTPAAITVSKVLARLGDAWVVALVGAIVVTVVRWRTQRWDAAWLVAWAVGGALAVTTVVKELTDRARPDGGLVDALSFAFPSGHASRAAATYLLIGWLTLRSRWSWPVRVVILALTIGMAVGTGVSRLVLGVHWLTDVFAGWALGGLWTLAVLAIIRPGQHANKRDAGAASDRSPPGG